MGEHRDDQRAPVDGGRLLEGRYRLGELLGRGGAAAVYEAVDTVLGRRVAVKLYQAADPVGRYRFGSEARLLAGLSHPGLVTVHDVCLDGDQPFLVLQLVDGPTLRELMNPGPFRPEAVARLGTPVARALAHIHARGVVHRDIKPANILITPAGEPLLSDFGLARVASAAHLTRTGEYVGTAAYLAPEQITDVEVGPSADIYALGLVLLECLTGRTEYTGHAAETALARLSRPPRIPEGLPPAWRSLLAAMTARNPADRPPAARCAELLAPLAEHPATAPFTAIPSPIPCPSSSSRSTSRRRGPARLRPVHAGVAALALTAVPAVAAATTHAVPGNPVGQPASPAPETTRTTSETPSPATDATAGATADATVTERPHPRTPAPPPAIPPAQATPTSQTGSGPSATSGKKSGKGSKDKTSGKGHGKG